MAEKKNRRSDRLTIILPISVSGRNAAGNTFAEDASTVTVSQHGAAIALKTEIVPGQDIMIRRNRLPVPREAECHVLGQIGKQPGLNTFSVAFLDSAVGFWDIFFPALPSDVDTAGRALLGCQLCGTRKIVHLNPDELADYNAHRQISLHCDNCGKSATWLESGRDPTKPTESGAPIPVRLAPASPAAGEDKRKHRRVAAVVPVCIRRVGSDDDVSTSLDISHGGMRLTSRRHYSVGTYIKVAVPFSTTSANVFVDARVVHISQASPQDVYQLGVMYLNENEPSS